MVITLGQPLYTEIMAINLQNEVKRNKSFATSPSSLIGIATDTSRSSHLSPIELEIIHIFVQTAQVLGLPKSVGEIYGLLYCSLEPLNFYEIMHRLKISKGSTSQSLRFLRNIRAVKTTYVAGERKDHFVAELRLRNLSAGFLRERIMPHLENGEERLTNLQQILDHSPPEERKILKERMSYLFTWNKKARGLLPWVLKFIDT